MTEATEHMAEQFSTFYLGDLLFGVPVQLVQEVVRPQEITPVQLSSPVIAGLINLRGQILTAIDLRRRLSMEPAHDRRPMNVVVRSNDEVVSLLVDEIGDVLEVDSKDFEEPSETLSSPCRELVRAVCKLEKTLLLVLNVEKTVAV